jgi:TetR/AcrR family transcriptional regulator, lmrAB and yxaGH operons repressor
VDEPNPRERIVRSTAHLMRRRGINGVGLREIVEHAGSPRGSLQRYFPGGKTQLVEEAVEFALTERPNGFGEAIRTAPTIGAAVEEMLVPWRDLMIEFDYEAGCPVAPVVIDGIEDEALRRVAASGFERWRSAVQKVFFVAFDVDEAEARILATGLVSAIEGAVLLSRARRDLTAFDDVALLFGRLGAGTARRLPLTDDPALG